MSAILSNIRLFFDEFRIINDFVILWHISITQIQTDQILQYIVSVKLAQRIKMRKIVFVQKQQSSTYDPVSTFFANSNKKSASAVKVPPSSSSSAQQSQAIKKQSVQMKPAGSVQRPPTTKNTVANDNSNQNKKYEEKEKPVTSKIGRKGQYNMPPPAQRKKQDPLVIKDTGKRQQSIYGTGGASKKNIRNYTNQANQQQQDKPMMNQYEDNQRQQAYFPNVNERRSPSKPPPSHSHSYQQKQSRQLNQPQSHNNINKINNNQSNNNNTNITNNNNNSNSNQQLIKLKNRIKQLQSQQQQYIVRLKQMEDKQQKYAKIEQKYNKLVKQHKICGNQTKQTSKKLKQKQDYLKKILSKQQIPYNKKRQIILMNQISTLKKINRQLVTRIKNYKGTDLVQLSLAQNKTDVLFKDYDHSVTITDNGQLQQIPPQSLDVAKVQSLAYRLVQHIDRYLDNKSNGKQFSWVNQKKSILQISELSKQLSLQCLNSQLKIPKDNKQCANMYNQIQKYRHMVQPVISKYDLNFIITQQNIQFINKRNQEISGLMEMKQAMSKSWVAGKKFKKPAQACQFYLDKFKQNSTIFTNSLSFSNIMLAHSLAQIQFLQSWYKKLSSSLKQELKLLLIKLKQLEELASLGENGKQSLCAYVWENVGDWAVKVPELEIKIKSIGDIFRNVPGVSGIQSGGAIKKGNNKK